jgi:hypothetical protein
MMYRMVKNMLYFIVLLLVVLVSFGVCNQSIKYPNEDWDWRQVATDSDVRSFLETDFALVFLKLYYF